ncbi:MAG: ISAzo13 family transposase [Actinomycetia bacterium]|nr:ISAzo13 family transposase [Actinomycetes bacterium]
MEFTAEALKDFFDCVLPGLGERDRRLVMGATAVLLGWGGQARVVEATGMSSSTVLRGAKEARGDIEVAEPGRQRHVGAGRKSVIDCQPGLLNALDDLVWPQARGHPETPLRYTCKSTYNLADALRAKDWEISAETVRVLLPAMGYSLQAPVKTKEGNQHADRDGQFGYINDMADDFIADGQPVISVDTKKKELIGNYYNKGREWQEKGQPVEVAGHDFPDRELGEHTKAIPYGVYDVLNNEGWVNVGDTADTAEFAVESIRRWWNTMGSERFGDATRLMITADCGGSNGYRVRAWKKNLANLATETGLAITVCHYPPGTSKWNKIEHRMFSFISMNWRGEPLTDLRTIVELIAGTTTKAGLSIRAEQDLDFYPTGVKISDADLKALPINAHHDWHPEWNYTITPTIAT